MLLAIPGAAAILGTLAAPAAARLARPSTVVALGVLVSLTGTATMPVVIGLLDGSVPWLIAGATLITFGAAPAMVLGPWPSQ